MYQINVILVGQGGVLLRCAEVMRQAKMIFSVLGQKGHISEAFTYVRLASLGIPALMLCPEELLDHVRIARKPLLVFSISNNILFPKDIVEHPDITIINYHNAILRRHRGRNCEAWQIYYQESCAGVTWHYVDAGVDTGAVARDIEIPITKDMTSLGLLQCQGNEAVRLFREELPRLLKVNSRARLNTTKDATDLAVMAPLHFSWEKPNDGILDPSWPAARIWAFLRSMDYGCLYTLGRPVIDWNGTRYIWSGYGRDGRSQSIAEAKMCMTGSIMTFSYPDGCIYLRDCKALG